MSPKRIDKLTPEQQAQMDAHADRWIEIGLRTGPSDRAKFEAAARECCCCVAADMTPYYSDESVTLYHGDALTVLRDLPDASVDCCVTSPPYYGLRDYGIAGQLGLESSPGEYVGNLRNVFAEVRRVLADDGTCWLNLGDSYVSLDGAAGAMASNLGTACLERPEARDPEKFGRWNRAWDLPAKNLLGMPWRVAFALQDDGWILRNAIVWNKPNAMPESVTDRLSCRYELLFLLAKSKRYWFDLDAIKVPLTSTAAEYAAAAASVRSNHALGSVSGRPLGRHSFATVPAAKNPGDVWTLPTQPFAEAHFAVMPFSLAERCVLAGCKPGGTVLDPFSGSGTTGLAATRQGRNYVGIDLNAEYLDLSLRTRLAQSAFVESGGVA